MGVVYHANYLAFFEAGRVEAMRQLGAGYSEMVQLGIHLPVVAACVRYRQPAYFDDVLLVHVRLAELRNARFEFDYEVTREADGAIVATGRTVHAAVSATTLRPMRLPAGVVAALRRLEGAAA